MFSSSVLLLALVGLARAQYGGDYGGGSDSGYGSAPTPTAVPATSPTGSNPFAATSPAAAAAPSATDAPFAAPATTEVAVGDIQCTQVMCIGATVNGDTVNYVMQSTGVQSLGWMGMGFGLTMVGSPMIIMWPNDDGTITITQREATGHVLPAVDPNPPRVASIDDDLTVTSGTMPKLAFSIPTDSNSKPQIIYAYGVDAPSSSDGNTASFREHVAFGRFSFDLTKSGMNATLLGSPAFSRGSSGKANSPGQGTSATRQSSPDMVILAHAVVCVVAFLVVMPAGALLARYYRTFSPTWFQGHWILQFGISGPIALAGLCLAIAISRVGGPDLSNTHTQVGFLLFGLYCTQCLLGGVIHFVKPKNAKGRPLQNYAHAVLGISIIALAFYQVHTGYANEWPNATGRPAPAAINILWYVWAVALPLLYAGGLALLKKQYRQEEEDRALNAKVLPWDEMRSRGFSV